MVKNTNPYLCLAKKLCHSCNSLLHKYETVLSPFFIKNRQPISMKIKRKFIYKTSFCYCSNKLCFLLGLTFANKADWDLATEICTSPKINPGELRASPGTALELSAPFPSEPALHIPVGQGSPSGATVRPKQNCCHDQGQPSLSSPEAELGVVALHGDAWGKHEEEWGRGEGRMGGAGCGWKEKRGAEWRGSHCSPCLTFLKQ